MAYTYLAQRRSGTPAAAFPRKHELARWLGRGGPFRNDALNLFRIASLPWNEDSIVVELDYVNGELIEKAP